MEKLVFRYLIFAVLAFISLGVHAQYDETPKMDTVPRKVRLYDSASALIDSAKYDKAMPILKKLVKDSSDYYNAYNKMAYIFIKKEKYKDAEKNLNIAESKSPLNYETMKLKGILYYFTERYNEAKNKIDSAVNEALADKIDDAEILYYQALLMYKGKSYKSSLGVCQAALDINPKYVDVLKLKGEVRYAMKDYTNAVKDLTEAINAMNDKNMDYNFYKLRAKSKFELKDFQGAVNDWTLVLDNDPKSEEALLSRANSKINMGDNSGAIADLDEAIKINPKNPISYCNRGIAKGQNKNYVEALKDMDYAIKLKFDYAEAYFRRASIKFKSKDKHGACEDLAKADSLGDPDAIKYIDQFCKVK